MPPRLVECRRHHGALEDGELLLPRKVAAAREARQGGVAVDVARQQDEMVAGDRAGVMLAGPAAARLRATVRVVELPAAARATQLVIGARDGQLEADDRAHGMQPRLEGGIRLRLLGRLPGADRGIEAGVVGDGERRHAELGRARDQLLGVAGTVEEAEVAVRVEFAVVVRRAHRTTDDRTSVLFWKPVRCRGTCQQGVVAQSVQHVAHEVRVHRPVHTRVGEVARGIPDQADALHHPPRPLVLRRGEGHRINASGRSGGARWRAPAPPRRWRTGRPAAAGWRRRHRRR